jgi:2-oxoglutarate dehydrogenase E2 component (dihydrolipoamide succinyltransferase)
MAVVDLVMPKLGESIMEATILRWHKRPGEMVKMDETVLDIATDKVDSEVPSTAEGVLEEILFQENDVVPIGAVIARINTSGEASVSPAASLGANQESAYKMHDDQPQKQEIIPAENIPTTQQRFEQPSAQQGSAGNSGNYGSSTSSTTSTGNVSKPASTGSRFYSPLVLNIAQSENVSMSELETIPGSGNDGRVTKKDILQYVEDRSNASGRPQGNVPAQPGTAPSDTSSREIQKAAPQPERKEESSLPAQYGGNVEIIEMDRMRKMISKHMTDSKHTSAHVTSFSEADVTNMVLWRDRIKKEFEKRENEKITFTPLFIEAIVKCIKKYPWLNSSVDGDKIIIRKDINIGMATALPTGNLIVPVIKNADQLNLVGLTKKVNGMANAARNNKLRPDDTAGGTFTMTNVGSFGSIMGTPIINQPQVAILAVGAIKKKPVVIETEQGDSIAIRHMMYLSMSYDHRIIDGALGSTFLNAVAKELENFNPNREF